MSNRGGCFSGGVLTGVLWLLQFTAAAGWGQAAEIFPFHRVGRASLSDRISRVEPRNAVDLPPAAAEDRASAADSSAVASDNSPLELSPSLLRLRDRIRACLAHYYRQPEDTKYRSPWGIMHAMLPYGVEAQVKVGTRHVNAIGWLCWNGKGQNLTLLEVKQGTLQPRSGPGMQGHDAQFLFMLAQCRVPIDYPIKVDGYSFTVADLVEYEKSDCESGKELNFKLVGLSHYLESDAVWRSRRGERWDIPRLIREELTQPIIGACCGGTHRLMGFSYAVQKRESRGEPVVGQWLRAQKYIEDYHEYALRLQNPDGSFSTDWFRSRQRLDDPERVLETTGHMVEWLVYSLPAEELVSGPIVKSVDFLSRLLLDNRDRDWAVGPKGHALHALAIYDERLFGGKPGGRPYLVSRPN